MFVSLKRNLVPALLLGLTAMSDQVLAQDIFSNSDFEIPYWDDSKPVAELRSKGIALAKWLPAPKAEPLPPEPVVKADEQQLIVSHDEPALAMPEKPSELHIETIGGQLDISYLVQPGAQVFVRDGAIVSFEEGSYTLTAAAAGTTEIYFVNGDAMSIAHLSVGQPEQADLEVPVDFAKIAVVEAGETAGDSYASLSQPYKPGMNVPSLKDSQTEGLDEYSILPQTISLPKRGEAVLYKKIAIKVIDPQANGNGDSQRPVPGVDVELLGSQFKGRTDVRGIVEIADVPAGSRFQVAISDRTGRIVNQVVDIPTEKSPESELFTVRAMAYDIFTVYAETVGVTQQASLSSMCLRLMNDDGSQTLADLQVEIKNENGASSAAGPFYFNRFAPSLDQESTGENGRFCYFNLDPGLIELEVLDDDGLVTSTTIGLAAASHLEDDLYLTSGSSITTRIVALPQCGRFSLPPGHRLFSFGLC